MLKPCYLKAAMRCFFDIELAQICSYRFYAFLFRYQKQVAYSVYTAHGAALGGTWPGEMAPSRSLRGVYTSICRPVPHRHAFHT